MTLRSSYLNEPELFGSESETEPLTALSLQRRRSMKLGPEISPIAYLSAPGDLTPSLSAQRAAVKAQRARHKGSEQLASAAHLPAVETDTAAQVVTNKFSSQRVESDAQRAKRRKRTHEREAPLEQVVQQSASSSAAQIPPAAQIMSAAQMQ